MQSWHFDAGPKRPLAQVGSPFVVIQADVASQRGLIQALGIEFHHPLYLAATTRKGTYVKHLLALALLAFGANESQAQNLTYQDVLGRVFINDVGSSMGGFLMSVAIKVEGRNTVSVGFVEGSVIWSEPSIAAVESRSEPTHVQYVMINCKGKTYSTYPEPKNENGYTVREFRAGTKYKWGDYTGQDLLVGVSTQIEESLTKYFSAVCKYTEQ